MRSIKPQYIPGEELVDGVTEERNTVLKPAIEQRVSAAGQMSMECCRHITTEYGKVQMNQKITL